MTESRHYTQSPQVLFTELDDGTGVLLQLDTKFYYTLNPTAVAVWKAIAGAAGSPSAAPAIVERLTREFRVERDEAARDVDHVLAELVADGLVVAS
jgi:hypothetical protein